MRQVNVAYKTTLPQRLVPLLLIAVIRTALPALNAKQLTLTTFVPTISVVTKTTRLKPLASRLALITNATHPARKTLNANQ